MTLPPLMLGETPDKNGVFFIVQNEQELKRHIDAASTSKAIEYRLIIEIHKLSQYIDFIEYLHEKFPGYHRLIYRGHANASYKLIPKGMRSTLFDNLDPTRDQVDSFESKLLRAFQLHGWPYAKDALIHPDNLWEWLALAQHHGMPTRMLDWSFQATSALYFAVYGPADDKEPDSCVWAVQTIDQLTHDEASREPKLLGQVRLFVPPHLSPRITMQDGCFTVHPSHYLVRPYQFLPRLRILFTIPKYKRAEILQRLSATGVSTATQFPGLDGLSRHLTETLVP